MSGGAAASVATLPLPPHLQTADGSPRRLGVELEFAGVDLDEVASIVASHTSGNVESITDYERKIVGDSNGDWMVEVDFELLKEMGRRSAARRSEQASTAESSASDAGTAEEAERDWTEALSSNAAALLDTAEELAEGLLDWGARPLVPTEVVSPPIPLSELHEVNKLIAALRKAGAVGTSERWFYAFGMHMNPELPALDATTICSYLKAYFCLNDWLRERSSIDMARRLTPYIDPFPAAYVQRVVDPDYDPDLKQLIDDYLTHNPTRNRSLDMLPLFSHLDSARVRARVDDPRIKSRPTLHYRLPNCEIGEDGWDLTPAWTAWLQVEHLADDKARLGRLCERFHRHLRDRSGLLPTGDFPIEAADLAKL